MDVGGDISLLTDEKFDFDISLSPTSGKQDDCDDEVFIGPVGHKEKCVSVAIKSTESDDQTPPHLNDQLTWSPLSGDKFVEIFKEAHLLALQLECFSTEDQKKDQPAEIVRNEAVEKFIQESKCKLNIFDALKDISKTPVAIKRETYCVQDSPFNQLPPSIQQRFCTPSTGCGTVSASDSPKPQSPLNVPKCPKELLVSPLAQNKAPQIKNTVPEKKPEKQAVSRLQTLKLPSAQTKNNLLTVEKPKTIKKFSPVRRKHLNSAGSNEDLLSDKSSIASDVSDSSFNSSVVGQNKRTLTVPTKLGLKTQFKQPSTSAGFRKNMSSSSSSSSSSHSSINSSLNSSLSVSPSGGKLNASLNSSINGSRLHQKTNPSRLALVRPNSGSTSSLKTNGTGLSNGLKKPMSATRVAAAGDHNKTSSVSVAHPQTPAGRMQKQISAPNLHKLSMQSKPDSAVKGTSCNFKPQARVIPTPPTRLKVPQKPGGMTPDQSAGKTLQPARLLSYSEIGSGIAESTPMKSNLGSLPKPNFSERSISATPTTKRLSALPTPLSRRTSAIPSTPKTLPRSISVLRPSLGLQASNKPMRNYLAAGTNESEGKNGTISPSSCEEDIAQPAAVPCTLNFSPEAKSNIVVHSEMEKSPSFPQSTEILLIDIELETTDKVRKPSSIVSDSQPLIDLSNTPDLNKKLAPLKPTQVGQLIDFSSPLIKLSPMVNKENMDVESPLLKF